VFRLSWLVEEPAPGRSLLFGVVPTRGRTLEGCFSRKCGRTLRNRFMTSGIAVRGVQNAAERTLSEPPSTVLMPTVGHARCARYTPGHQTHAIQARLASEVDPANYLNGTVVSVEDDGWITVDVSGEPLRFWTHDPTRVRHCFEESGWHVGLPGYGVLHARSARGGRYCICVSDRGPTPCAPPSTASSSPEDLYERVLTHGGFLVAGTEALRHLHDDGRDGQRGIMSYCQR
jgi:hypothetical protein